MKNAGQEAPAPEAGSETPDLEFNISDEDVATFIRELKL
jgi:hypothetical protein